MILREVLFMRHKKWLLLAFAGLCAGGLNGFFGGGGGMLLVPILTWTNAVDKEKLFPTSVAIILPICVVSLMFSSRTSLESVLPYLMGSAIGGTAAGLYGNKIPVLWLHRALGVLIIWGGIRYLCNG